MWTHLWCCMWQKSATDIFDIRCTLCLGKMEHIWVGSALTSEETNTFSIACVNCLDCMGSFGQLMDWGFGSDGSIKCSVHFDLKLKEENRECGHGCSRHWGSQEVARRLRRIMHIVAMATRYYINFLCKDSTKMKDHILGIIILFCPITIRSCTP